MKQGCQGVSNSDGTLPSEGASTYHGGSTLPAASLGSSSMPAPPPKVELSLGHGLPTKQTASQHISTNTSTNPNGSSQDRLTRRDLNSIVLLLVLYTIQGIPMGLRGAIPIFIYDRISYTQLGLLAFSSIPFSLKIFWAPIVDFLYSRRIGRRKSWLIPTQLITGAILLYASFGSKIDRWIGEEGDVEFTSLLFFFLALYFLMATQDIVVDGWAISMLRPSLRIHASTCNSVGQHLGANLAFIGLMTLSNRDSCIRIHNFWQNLLNWLGFGGKVLSEEEEAGFKAYMQMSDFTLIFGLVIVVVTVVISLWREDMERPLLSAESDELSVQGQRRRGLRNGYVAIKELISMKPVKLLTIALFAMTLLIVPEKVGELKILENGFPKDIFVLVTPFMIPFEIVVPAIVSVYIKKYTAYRVLRVGYILRMLSMLFTTGKLDELLL